MKTGPRSLEELLPLPTAGELIAQKRQPLVRISSDESALAALRVMEEANIGFLPVVDGEKLVGALSERDIARGVILRQRSLVRDIMTAHVHTVTPETKVSDCVLLMHREHIRHLPVESGGTIHGVLSMRDLMSSLIERHERLLRRLQDERVTALFPYSSSY
jgi:CBS domain-containing protein